MDERGRLALCFLKRDNNEPLSLARAGVQDLSSLLKGMGYNVSMDVHQIIKELHEERERIIAATESLQRLAADRSRRRGRPPKWMEGVTEPRRRGRPPGSKNTTKGTKKAGKKRTISAAARKRQSERMKIYWASRRKAAKK